MEESDLPLIAVGKITQSNWVNYDGTLSQVGKAKDIGYPAEAYNPEYMYWTRNGYYGYYNYAQYYVADRSTAAFYNNNTISLTYDHVITVGDVDTSRLTELIAQAKELIESNYTPASWAVLQEALAKAENQLELGVHGQKLIDRLYDELLAAMNALESCLDTSALEALIVQAKAIEQGDYTDASWGSLQAEIENAELLLAGGSYTQDEIDDACTTLQAAIDALEEIQKTITAFVVDSYESAIDQRDKTIIFTLPDTALTGNQLIGTITGLSADNTGNQLGFIIDGVTHQPFSIGSRVGFKDGDQVFAQNGDLYTIRFDVQAPATAEIRAFSVDSNDAVIDQTAKTVTFTPPASAMSGDQLIGNITALDADAGSLGFIIDGTTHQPFSLGSRVGFKDGDQVFALNNNIYTIRITPQEPVPETPANPIYAFSVGGHTGSVDQAARTITFQIPAAAMNADGRLIGNIDVLTTDGADNTLTFIVWDNPYAGYKRGDLVGFHDMSEVYVAEDSRYVIQIIVE